MKQVRFFDYWLRFSGKHVRSHRFLTFILLCLGLSVMGCVRPFQNPQMSGVDSNQATAVANATLTPALPTATATPSIPLVIQMGTAVAPYPNSPTPDAPHPTGNVSRAIIQHTVVEGDTLGTVALEYESSIEALSALNEIADADIVFLGQQLNVPGPAQENLFGPSFKIIPDSELVYSPSAQTFDLAAFLAPLDGYLLSYEEEVEGQPLAGPDIVQLVADRYSVNPRLLLAMLEHKSGWVTQKNVANRNYPLQINDSERTGLYRQLTRAANLLNLGYYGRSVGGLRTFFIDNLVEVAYAADINHGTAAIQFFLATADDATLESWQDDVGPHGFLGTYQRLFSNPFSYTFEPLIPNNLNQPPFGLPWENGEAWHFSGGPHGGWDSGSAWAALDFVPPGEQFGCYTADEWVTAVAAGVVTRSNFGAVVVDLEGDGTGAGWAITYMHLAEQGRIAEGTAVTIGDPLGHPSCAGGFSNGTHVHLSRTYNGQWISADGDVPFNLDGWLSQGSGVEYNGTLERNGRRVAADAIRSPDNLID